MMLLEVTKVNGQKEPFSLEKVFASAVRVGASKDQALMIAKEIKKNSYSGIKTSDIFRQVKKLLKSQSPGYALRFNLKKAIKELGPTGFPFEKYIGEIFKNQGFFTKINQYVPGECILDYEIDFIAQKEDLIFVGECKYRNIFGEKVDLKDALASYARFSDILSGPYFKSKKSKNIKPKTILVSNGKFTKNAIAYSTCKGVELLGWRFPRNNGLEYLIESHQLYPITIFSSLKGYVKKALVEQELMLAKDILNIDLAKLAQRTRLSEKDFLSLKKEANLLFNNQNNGRKKQKNN